MILQYPNSALRQKSIRVIEVDQELVAEMKEYQGSCLGLAAVQLGSPVQLIMVKYGEDYIYLINPEIVKRSKRTYPFPEGCLSINQGTEQLTFHRPKRVKVRYNDLVGNPKTIKATGLDARVLQHEIDHLEGILIVDYE